MIDSETELLKDWVNQELKGDSDLFDFDHLIDRTLSFRENKEILKERIKYLKDDPHEYFKGGIMSEKDKTKGQELINKLEKDIKELQLEHKERMNELKNVLTTKQFDSVLQLLFLDQELSQQISFLNDLEDQDL